MARRETKKYDKVIEKYMKLYPMLSNAALAREIVENEDLEIKPNHLRSVIGDYLRRLVPENVRLEKREQKRRDLNRIKNKAFREFARVENAVEEYTKNLVKELQENATFLRNGFRIPEIEDKDLNTIGVLQLSDLHTNELINLEHNQYNFDVFSRRLKKFIHQARIMFKAHGITKILVAFTGDIINSDRRLDELLNQAMNRAKASIMTAHLLTHALMDLRQDFELDIVSVMGNESRMGKDFPSHSNIASDNYDFTILAIIREQIIAAQIPGVNFLSIDQMEEVIDILGQKWLISHDYRANTSKQDKAQSTLGRYRLAGVNIDFLIGGHIHATRITDISARSSSMAGSNEYNENFLNLGGRAAQNIYIVTRQSRHSMVIDLQNVDGVEGYPVYKHLEAYNSKSEYKSQAKTTVLEVVI